MAIERVDIARCRGDYQTCAVELWDVPVSYTELINALEAAYAEIDRMARNEKRDQKNLTEAYDEVYSLRDKMKVLENSNNETS